jgi:tetratricopeptide (TPR) repeat protein
MLQRANLRGIPAEAESAARRAVQLAPKASKTHVQLAEVLAAKKDFKGAREEADEAIKLEPRLAGAHLIKAIVLLTDKDPLGAIQASDNALRYDRTLTQAEFIKANAYMDTKQYDEAIGALDTVDRDAGGMIADPQRQMLRGRIYFKQRKFKQSYRRFLTLQRMNPRFRFLAPALAGLSMVLFGVFGTGGQYALIALFVLIVLAILFGLSFIPVVGGWLVAVITLGIVGVVAFGAVRQSRGRIFPAEMPGRLTTVVGALMLFVAGLAVTLWIANAFSKHGWFNPSTLALGGSIGLILSAVGVTLLGRFGGRSAAA